MEVAQLRHWIETLTDAGASSDVTSECIGKMERGEAKYGTWEPDNDNRSMTEECLEELYDGVNYLLMELCRTDRQTELATDMLYDLVNIIERLETHAR